MNLQNITFLKYLVRNYEMFENMTPEETDTAVASAINTSQAEAANHSATNTSQTPTNTPQTQQAISNAQRCGVDPSVDPTWVHSDCRVYDPDLKYNVSNGKDGFVDNNYTRQDFQDDYGDTNDEGYETIYPDRFDPNLVTNEQNYHGYDNVPHNRKRENTANNNTEATPDETNDEDEDKEEPKEKKCKSTDLLNFDCYATMKIVMLSLFAICLIILVGFVSYVIYNYMFSSSPNSASSQNANTPTVSELTIVSDSSSIPQQNSVFSGLFNGFQSTHKSPEQNVDKVQHDKEKHSDLNEQNSEHVKAAMVQDKQQDGIFTKLFNRFKDKDSDLKNNEDHHVDNKKEIKDNNLMNQNIPYEENNIKTNSNSDAEDKIGYRENDDKLEPIQIDHQKSSKKDSPNDDKMEPIHVDHQESSKEDSPNDRKRDFMSNKKESSERNRMSIDDTEDKTENNVNDQIDTSKVDDKEQSPPDDEITDNEEDEQNNEDVREEFIDNNIEQNIRNKRGAAAFNKKYQDEQIKIRKTTASKD